MRYKYVEHTIIHLLVTKTEGEEANEACEGEIRRGRKKLINQCAVLGVVTLKSHLK